MRTAARHLRFRIIALQAALLAGLGAGALLLPNALAGPPVVDAARPVRNDDGNRRNAIPEAVQQRIAAIRTALQNRRTRPWEGDYYFGDGLGANISISLSLASGIAATWYGCLGLYGANEGTVDERPDGTLRFDYHQPNRDAFGGFPDRLRPVQWGQRHYLIDPSQVAAFVDAINQGGEPRVRPLGRFLLEEGNEHARVDGLPDLPAQDLARIRTQPMTARVASVIALPSKPEPQGEMCERSWRLVLKTGGNGTLAAGDILHPELPENVHADLVLETASRGHAAGVVSVFEPDCDMPAVPDAGWVFSTGAWDPVAANQRIDEAARQSTR